ncbi:hypothetical protein BH11MYX2_BH11MYX2_07660 [soil metagenome]
MTGSLALTAAERRRADRIDQLVALGASAVDELVGALAERSWTVRRLVISALASLGDDAVLALCTWLRSTRGEEHAISAAVDALSTSNGPSANAEVAKLADGEDPAVVADAAAILGRRKAKDQVPTLAKLLTHADDNVAVAAIEAIGSIGGSVAIDELVALLARREFFRTFPAIQILGRSADPRVVAPLAELLSDEIYQVEAARALGRTGAAQAVAPLASLLVGGDDAKVRLVALSIADLITRAAWVGAAAPVALTLREALGRSARRFVEALAGGDLAERTAIIQVLGVVGDGATLEPLVRLLDTPGLGPTAIEAIRQIGRSHESALTDALAHGDTTTRTAILPMITARRAVGHLRDLLSDEEAEVRARAAEALARIGDASELPRLFALLGDPNLRVSLAAAGAIQSLGAATTSTLAIQALKTGTAAVRRQVLRIIGYLGLADAFDAVVAAAAEPDIRTAELAVAALGSLDTDRTDQMVRTLARSPVPTLRAAALRSAVLRPAPLPDEVLEAGLADDVPWVRYYACRGLAEVSHPRAPELLVARLTDAMPHVRIAAIEALARVDSRAAWQALASAVRSTDPDERRAALVGISQRPDSAAVDLLVEASHDPDPATQLIALAGLAKATELRALTRIAAVADSRDPDLREAAISLLAERTDQAAAEVLIELALHASVDHPAHLALSRPYPARIAALAQRMTGSDENEAAVLVPALARITTPAATAALVELLSDANPIARRTAAVALVAVSSADAMERVRRMAVEDPDPDVRLACAAAVS